MHAQAFPQQAQAELAGATGPLAELDCDIIIDEAPDSLTPQIEQFQALVELKKYDRAGEIPFSAIVRAIPNLKDKQAFLKDMEQQQAQAAQRAQSAQPQGQPPALQQLQLRGAVAEVAETGSKAALNFAKARQASGDGSEPRHFGDQQGRSGDSSSHVVAIMPPGQFTTIKGVD